MKTDELIGTTVYKRGTDQRGTITEANYSKNEITVKWRNGKETVCPVSELMSEKLYNDERMKKMNTIKKEDCKYGVVVYLKSNHAPLSHGTLAGPADPNGLVVVEWNGGRLSKHAITSLLDEKAGEAENKRLLDEQERLEKEFERVETECKTKLEKAADLIREASSLAHSKGKDLQEMYEAVRPLERAMDDAGWSTSSWHC